MDLFHPLKECLCKAQLHWKRKDKWKKSMFDVCTVSMWRKYTFTHLPVSCCDCYVSHVSEACKRHTPITFKATKTHSVEGSCWKLLRQWLGCPDASGVWQWHQGYSHNLHMNNFVPFLHGPWDYCHQISLNIRSELGAWNPGSHGAVNLIWAAALCFIQKVPFSVCSQGHRFSFGLRCSRTFC